MAPISVLIPCAPIPRSLVPNLRRLNICWNNSFRRLQVNGRVEVPTGLFSRDVFFHLTHFSLVAKYLANEIVQELISMLSIGCSYSLDLYKSGEPAPLVLGQTIINTFCQLKGWKPMEVKLNPYSNSCEVRAYTLPHKCRELDVGRYLRSQTALA
jgi:hypothetical protein